MIIKKAIKDLYYRTLEDIRNTAQYTKMLVKYEELKQKLDEELSEEQKSQFVVLADLAVDMSEELNRQVFEEGFALGIRIATEVYYREDTKQSEY